MNPEDYRFEIALSFAGDNKRDLVREVAELLREKVGNGKIFFDEWFESELAGPDAQIVLQNYYGKMTRLVVACVCQRYNEKPWTQEEWRAIQAFERGLRDAGTDNVKRMRFLPLRFGDGEIDGLFSTVIIPDVRNRSPKEIAELILKRLDLAINGIANKEKDPPDKSEQGMLRPIINNPKQIIRECLNESFLSIDDLKGFCFFHFEGVHREIKKEDGHGVIVTRIMQHCYANACMDLLWECIKIERSNQYKKYYPMWERAEKDNR